MDPMDDEERPELPASLRAVAYFTVLCGIGCVLTTTVSLFHGRLHLNFGALQVFSGLGLLRLSQGWRTFQLWMLWFGMIGAILGIVLILAGVELKSDLSDLTLPFLDRVQEQVILLICVGVFGLEFWQYRVLTSPVVRRLFGLISTREAPPDDPERGAGPGGSASGPLPGS